MAHNIYLGNLPEWVTADDIKSWLDSSDLVSDSVRVIRDFETQESKGYAFIEAPNQEEMEAIIQRFNRAPIDGKLLRAKTAHPKGDRQVRVPRKRRRERDGSEDAAAAPSVGVASEAKKSSQKNAVGTLGEALQRAL
ncbi:MAG: RNA-binding protein [Acidobacteria bacterium]|nr:RNA-binding protein [Acidobacteriota bacterium]